MEDNIDNTKHLLKQYSLCQWKDAHASLASLVQTSVFNSDTHKPHRPNKATVIFLPSSICKQKENIIC